MKGFSFFRRLYRGLEQYNWESLLVFLMTSLVLLPISTGAQELTIMTYNIYHGERADSSGNNNLLEIAEIINQYKPDFVALQEVDSMTVRSGKINNENPLNLVQELAELTGMNGLFGKAIDFDNGGYGVGILSAYPVEGNLHRLPLPEEGEERVLLEVSSKTGDQIPLVFAGTHLCHKSEKNRMAQVEAITCLYKDKDIPVIVAGDFNFEPHSQPYKSMTFYFNDAAHVPGSRGNTFPSDDPQRRIDYLFLSANTGWIVTNVEVVKSEASDHLPVVVTLISIHRLEKYFF